MGRTATLETRKNRWPGNKACLEYARVALSMPPQKPHIVRPPAPLVPPVWQCVLPAEWCVPQNTYSRMKHWQIAELKAQILRRMLSQHLIHGRPEKRTEPLPGRPRVNVVRFTSTEPDRGSGWEKIPVDCLVRDWVSRTKKGMIRAHHEGLGFLVDDRPSAADIHAWWEPGKRGGGFVLIRVFEGDES